MGLPAIVKDKPKQQEIRFELVRDDCEYLVFRLCGKIYFVHPQHSKMVSYKLAKAKAAGFGGASTLMYMSEYIVDINTHEMIKNRYPDQEWPKQIMEELFSGVGNEIDIR